MTKRIHITTGSASVEAELNDTETAQAIWNALPIKSRCNIWGNEIYFSVPIKLGPENAHEVVEMGDLGYWPPGAAFCIFFGTTPASRGQEIRPASAVNVFGRVIGDTIVLKKAKDGAEIVIERITQD